MEMEEQLSSTNNGTDSTNDNIVLSWIFHQYTFNLFRIICTPKVFTCILTPADVQFGTKAQKIKPPKLMYHSSTAIYQALLHIKHCHISSTAIYQALPYIKHCYISTSASVEHHRVQPTSFMDNELEPSRGIL